MTNYSDVAASVTTSDDLVRLLIERTVADCDKLAEIAEAVENNNNRESVADLLKIAETERPDLHAQIVRTREILSALYKELRGDDSDSDNDALVEQAKGIFANVKRALGMIEQSDDVPATFSADFLAVVPKVEGARMITSAPGETKRFRFEKVTVNVKDTDHDVRTFTEAATVLKRNGVNVNASDLSFYYASNGEPAQWSKDNYTIAVVRKS